MTPQRDAPCRLALEDRGREILAAARDEEARDRALADLADICWPTYVLPGTAATFTFGQN